jgi:phosphatidylserine/phosphatidylglycerophosphate/cardiolipin synthase-like enzyme
MDIITNISPSTNHFAQYSHYAKLFDEIILMSPFVAHDLSSILKKETIKNLQKLSIITRLDNDFYELSRKINFLSTLQQLCNSTRNFSIKIDDKLHGKIYIFKKNGKPITGIVTSANLTLKGFKFNNELGILINNQNILHKIEQSIYANEKLYDLNAKTLSKI